MKIAIITVNYNGKKDTLEFLESLSVLPTANYQLRTIVVDNGSTDGSVGVIKAQYPDVEILQNGENKGFAGGFNRGLEYAQIWGADYFLIINNDTLIKDVNLLEELVKTVQLGKRIGLVSPKIYFAPGFEFHKKRYKVSDKGNVIWYAGGEFDWDNIQSKHRGIDEVDNGTYNNVGEVDFVSGACILIKKEVLEKVGMFDESLFAYLEDVDFLKRVKEAGFKIFFNGEVAIYHKVSQTAGIGSPITDYYHTRNRLILGFRYGSTRTKFALLREAFWILLFGRKAQRRGILDFYLGIAGGIPDVSTYDTPGVGQIEYSIKLSICIVSYNTADLTKKLLASIFKKDSGFDKKYMEVIVLDNGSKDNCQEVIKDFLLASRSGPKIQYLQNNKNTGFSRGYNKTIRFSKGQYVLMLNSDIEVMENGLAQMVKWADQFKGEAVLGGKLVFPDGSPQDSAYHLPTIWGAFKEYFLAKKGSYFMYMPKGNKGDQRNRSIQVEGLVMACFLIPRTIINKVGYLDEGTFIFFEDIEYCRRLKEFGIPIYYIPTAEFIHHHGSSTKRVGKEKAYDLLKKASRYYHGQPYYFLLFWVLKLGQTFGRVKTPISRWAKEDL